MDLGASVGRSWYVKITEGMVGARAELGTYHVAHGLQVWDHTELEFSSDGKTEADILGELYYALSLFLERRT